MTVTLELPPEIEAGLIASAEAEGLPVSDYLRRIVQAQIAAKLGADKTDVPAHRLPFDQWSLAFNAWVGGHADQSIVLPDDAMEREAIYGDRGL